MRPTADVAVQSQGPQDGGTGQPWTGCVGVDDRAAAGALVILGGGIISLELLDQDADAEITVPMMILDLHLNPELWQILAALGGHTFGKSARQYCDAIHNNPADPTWLACTLCGDSRVTVNTAPGAGI